MITRLQGAVLTTAFALTLTVLPVPAVAGAEETAEALAAEEDSSPRPPEARSSSPPGTVPLGIGALRSYKDPASGKLTAPPPGAVGAGEPAPRVRALLLPPVGLRQEPVRAAPGGIRVHLGGRFRSAVVTKRSPSGELALSCVAGEVAQAVPAREMPEGRALPQEKEESP